MQQELIVMLLSALPVTEMRAALPLALTTFQLAPATAIFWCVLGNILPIIFLLPVLPKLISWMQHSGPKSIQRLITRYLAYLKSKHTQSFEKIGAASLGAVTLLPLPGAGVWTGCVLAVLFQIRMRYSIPALVLGVFVEAVIIFLIVEGTLGALSWIL